MMSDDAGRLPVSRRTDEMIYLYLFWREIRSMETGR